MFVEDQSGSEGMFLVDVDFVGILRIGYHFFCALLRLTDNASLFEVA